MNKKLTNNGSKLSKNMTNTDTLSLSSLQCTNASFVTCNSNYIRSTDISCQELDIPINVPIVNVIGTTYYNDATKSLRIYDGAHWYQVVLTQVP